MKELPESWKNLVPPRYLNANGAMIKSNDGDWISLDDFNDFLEIICNAICAYL